MNKLILVVITTSLIVIGLFLLHFFTTVDLDLHGLEDMEIKQDRVFVDPGYEANIGTTSLTRLVEVSGEIDTTQVGKQELTYTLEYEGETYNEVRTVEVVVALTKEMAFDFFSNVNINAMEFLPDSLKETRDVESFEFFTDCVENSKGKFDFNNTKYDYCMTPRDNNLPMSNSYVDIYSSIKQFELLEKYTNTILHSMDSVSSNVDINSAGVITPYGRIGMEITDDIVDDSITFTGDIKYTAVVELDLIINAQLQFDYQTELYTVSYGYDIVVGYSFFGVTFYHMYAEAVLDIDYNLVELDVYTNIPAIQTKATSLTVDNNQSIEMISYLSLFGVYESKSFIYAEDNFGYAYKENDILALAPKEYFDVFTEDTMVFSYKVKKDHQESKFYLSGLNGWTEAYYLIDKFGPNNDKDSEIQLTDGTILKYTEKEFDDKTLPGITVSKEDAKFYYYSEDTNDIEEYKYSTETLYIFQDSNKGTVSAFTPPTGLMPIIEINMEIEFNNIQAEMLEYEILGILIFNTKGFDFDIPMIVKSFL